MDELPLPVYKLEQALISLKEHDNIFTSVEDIYLLAKAGKIQISFYKPDFKYVRIDEKDSEMEEIQCKPLGSWLVVPVKRSTGAIHGGAELFYGKHDDIYPFLGTGCIRDRDERGGGSFFMHGYNLKGRYKGEIVHIAKIGYRIFPKKGEPNYERFYEWLTTSYMMPFSSDGLDGEIINVEDYTEANFFYCMDNWRGRGLEIKESDLRITREDLKNYIDGKGGGTMELTPEEEPTPIAYNRKSQKKWMKWVIENKGLDESGNVKPRFRAGFLRGGKDGFSNGTLAKLYDSVIKDYKS